MARFCIVPPIGIYFWIGVVGWAPTATSLRGASIPIAAHCRWSNPSPHGNNIFGIAYNNLLHRAAQVTERGLFYYSDDLIDWTAREAGTDLALRAVAFRPSGRLIVVGEQGSVFYSDDLTASEALHPGHLLDGPTEDWLEGVAGSPTLWVAAGDSGALYLSDDGVTWRRQASGTATYLTGITYGGNGFVAVGESGTILHSENGTNWTQSIIGTQDWLDVTHGNDQYLAVGRSGTIATSVNGKVWTIETTGRTNDLWTAAVNSSARMVGGSVELLVSLNNGPWVDQLTLAKNPAPAGTYYASLARPEYFLAAGRGGLMAEASPTTNSTAFAWAENTPSLRARFWEVIHQGDLYVAVGENGAVMTSTEGRDWTLELVPRSLTNTTLLGIGGDTNLLIAVGARGAMIRSPNLLTNLPNADLQDTNQVFPLVAASSLGVLWLDVTPRPTTNQLQGVAAGHGLYVVVGEKAEILTSTNGVLWSHHNAPLSNLLSSVASWPGGFVACGQEGTLIGSTDGTLWSKIPSPTTAWLFRVRSLDGILIAVGEDGTLITSTDALTWTARNTGTTEFLTDVTLLRGSCVAIGQNGTFRTSSDYTRWTSLNPFTYRDLYGIATEGSQLILVGQDGVILRNQAIPITTPVALLSFSHTVSPTQTAMEELFLFGGSLDQGFVLESTENATSGQWTPGPYLELSSASGILTYLATDDLTNAPLRRYYRTRLVSDP